jgi:hypothetical protein
MLSVDKLLSKYLTQESITFTEVEEDWGNLRALPATWIKELKSKNLDVIGQNSDLVEQKNVSKANEVTKFVRSIETNKESPYIGAYLTANDNPLMLIVYSRRQGFYIIEPKNLEYAKNKDGSDKLDANGNKAYKNSRFPLPVFKKESFLSNDELQTYLKSVLKSNPIVKLFGVTVDTTRAELRQLRQNKKTSSQDQEIKSVLE